MEHELYQAIIKGNVALLTELYKQNEQILNQVPVGVCKSETALHIATRFGHVECVEFILQRNKSLALALNAEGLSPLHVASTLGRQEVVALFLRYIDEALLVCDDEGQTALHLAAMEGEVEIVKMLVDAKPTFLWQLTNKGDPLLHFCANHDQFRIIKDLIELVNLKYAKNLQGFVKMQDGKGNTVLHLLALKDHYQVIDDLYRSGLDVNIINSDGNTALDIAFDKRGVIGRWKFVWTLRGVEGLTSKRIGSGQQRKRTRVTRSNDALEPDKLHLKLSMVGMAFFTIIIFNAILNPPGGRWADDGYHYDPITSAKINHTEGHAILWDAMPHLYLLYKHSVTSGAISFLSTALLMMFNTAEFGYKFTKVASLGLFYAFWCLFNMCYVLDVNDYEESMHMARRLGVFNLTFRWVFVTFCIYSILEAIVYSSYLGRFLRQIGVFSKPKV